MACSVCVDPGDCEDCLDCLSWPQTVDTLLPRVRPATSRRGGPSSPSRASDLTNAREDLVMSRRVGLVARRFRRQGGLSQRMLATELGWSRASLGRTETDASAIAFGKVEALLRHTGHRLAIVVDDDDRVAGEPTTDQWGVPDLLALDQQGRRPPPASQVRWNSPDDRRLYTSLRDREWTWHRPSP